MFSFCLPQSIYLQAIWNVHYYYQKERQEREKRWGRESEKEGELVGGRVRKEGV